MISFKSVSFLIIALILQSACSFADKGSNSTKSDGYALLYSVVSKNQDVSKLLWIKSPGKSIETWVSDIAKLSSEVTTQLEAWKKDGTVQNLDNTGLPPTELAARARATSRTRGELLFSGGVDLRVDLIVAQLKALAYCADLSYAMEEEMNNSTMQTQFNSWQSAFTKLTETGLSLLQTDIPQN